MNFLGDSDATTCTVDECSKYYVYLSKYVHRVHTYYGCPTILRPPPISCQTSMSPHWRQSKIHPNTGGYPDYVC